MAKAIESLAYILEAANDSFAIVRERKQMAMPMLDA
jgi:hypothetical protein